MLDPPEEPKSLTRSQIENLRLPAWKMNGVERPGFQAQMTLKYCQGRARLAQTVLGWGRKNIELGLAEKRTGIICVGLQSAFRTPKGCQEKQPLLLWHYPWDKLHNLILNKTQHLKLP
ncbi:hypothetical protein RintRC_1453 [Richelia intracellularis]|nr:hypothetical protein RintRC_1453 [Richelia intracellularis]